MTVKRPDLPVDTTNSPLLLLTPSILYSYYVARIYCINLVSPQHNSNYSCLVSTSSSNGPAKLFEFTNLRGYLRRTTNSSLFTSEFGVKSITFCLECSTFGIFVEFLIWFRIDDSAFCLLRMVMTSVP